MCRCTALSSRDALRDGALFEVGDVFKSFLSSLPSREYSDLWILFVNAGYGDLYLIAHFLFLPLPLFLATEIFRFFVARDAREKFNRDFKFYLEELYYKVICRLEGNERG